MMTKFKQCTHIEGKCIEDIFNLPYIVAIEKNNGECYYRLSDSSYATIGDWLCEDYYGIVHVYTDDQYKRMNV